MCLAISLFTPHPVRPAEKALKAVYQHYGWEFQYTHDLTELVTGLKRQGLTVASEVEEAEFLTSFAWEARYPGLGEPVTANEHEEALRHAVDVVTWAEKELSS
ncbi:HEPN domain-containing protein [Thermodesulfobacteriota bacterium]